MYQYNRKGPKRGVALYSYSAEFGLEKTLEDCFEDVHDMGAHGIEILANTHIENYPYPTEEWVEQWFRLCDKYEVVPVEYGNWIDYKNGAAAGGKIRDQNVSGNPYADQFKK